MTKNIKIAPSILASDFSRLGDEVKAVTKAGADWIHIDVMDGHFVPNITMGPAIVQAIRGATDLPFDVHFMTAPVDYLIEPFARAGANFMTVHPESGPHIHRTLQLIHDQGCKAGLALNPGAPIELLKPVLEHIDLVLVMTVNPGFGGQKFIESQLGKIKHVRTLIDQSGRDILLEVDGGINASTAPRAVKAGADVLVAGTAIFKENSYESAIAQLKS